MARLWTCGFELRSASGGVEFDTPNGTAPTISTTVVRSGGASLRLNPSAAISSITHRFATNAIRAQHMRMAFRFASFPTADVDIFQWFDGTNGFPSVRFISSTQKLQVRDGALGNVGSPSATLALNTWYVLQMSFDDSSGDLVNAYLDGTQFVTNGVGGDIGGLGQVRFGLITASTADMYIDDIAINDTSGTNDTGLPNRNATVNILNVNAAGDNNLWAAGTGGTTGTANNFTRVSDLPPDDVTSYNQLATTGTTQIDDFNVTDASAAGIGSSDTIAFVGVGIRVASNGTTAASLVARLKGQSGGTVTESASINVNVNGWRTGGVVAAGNPQPSSNILAYANPQGSVAWTPAALDGIQVGYRANVSQSSTRRVTKVWALVEWVPAGSVPANVTPTTVAGTTAISGIAQAGATTAPGTVAGTTAVSGTAQAGAAPSPATILGVTTTSAVAQAGSAPAPLTIAPTKVAISGTASASSTALPATVAGTTTMGAFAQAGAVPVVATIAPPAVTISGTAMAGSAALPATIAPPKVAISGMAETSSATTVPASTIAPPKVAISGTALTGSTAPPATIAPPVVAISAAAQSSRTAAVATVLGIAAVSGTAQVGAVAVVTTIAGITAVAAAAQAGAVALAATVLGGTTVSGTASASSLATPGTIFGTSAISGSATASSGVVVTTTTIAGTTAITGAGSTSQAAAAATILGTTAISGVGWAGSTVRPAAIVGVVEIGPHMATSSSGAATAPATIAPPVVTLSGTARTGTAAVVTTVLGAALVGPGMAVTYVQAATVLGSTVIAASASGASGTAVNVTTIAPQPAVLAALASASRTAQPGTVLGVASVPPATVKLIAIVGTITGTTTIGPHLIVRTGIALAATILGSVAMPRPALLTGYVTPGDPTVIGDPAVGGASGESLVPAQYADPLTAAVNGVRIRAGVS